MICNRQIHLKSTYQGYWQHFMTVLSEGGGWLQKSKSVPVPFHHISTLTCPTCLPCDRCHVHHLAILLPRPRPGASAQIRTATNSSETNLNSEFIPKLVHLRSEKPDQNASEIRADMLRYVHSHSVLSRQTKKYKSMPHHRAH